MGALRRVAVVLALATSAPACADPLDQWRPLIAEASLRFGIPSTWIERVMRAESRGRKNLAGRPIRSAAGAIGLMQVMPATWAAMRVRLGLGKDPDDPRDNILAGAFYLRLMYERFGYPGLFAAYNAGPARYREALVGTRRLPSETIGYLAAVGGIATVVSHARPADASSGLFSIRRDASAAVPVAAAQPITPLLFAVRKAEP